VTGRGGQGDDPHDAEELRRFFTLAPEDFPVVDAVRGDGRRLARALLRG
jgi:hypothetical protein